MNPPLFVIYPTKSLSPLRPSCLFIHLWPTMSSISIPIRHGLLYTLAKQVSYKGRGGK